MNVYEKKSSFIARCRYCLCKMPGQQCCRYFFCGWCTVHIMLVKFCVPKNKNVYQYEYHVKNLI